MLAEDLVQEAFARVWASHRTPSSPPEFQRWLFRTITNLARDHHRRQAVLRRIPFWSVRPVDPTEEAERRIGDPALLQAFRRLRLRERIAVHLRYYEDRSFSEVGSLMGVRESSARVLVHRALGRLRQSLASALVGEALCDV